MAKEEAISLTAFVAQRLRWCRETHSLRQDVVASVARAWGFDDWTQATVAAIESGRRQLRIEELLLLPWVFTGMGPANVLRRPADTRTTLATVLAGDPDKPIKVSNKVRLPGRGVQMLFTGDTSTALEEATFRPDGASRTTALAVGLAAERNAARRLEVSPEAVVEVAQQLWGRTLTDERDARVGKLVVDDGEDTAERRRMIQAHRGHVTRALMAELTEGLKSERPKRRRRGKKKS